MTHDEDDVPSNASIETPLAALIERRLSRRAALRGIAAGALSLPFLTGTGTARTGAGAPLQFERQGYFAPDPDSTPDRLVFNRTVALRDSWAKIKKKGG